MVERISHTTWDIGLESSLSVPEQRPDQAHVEVHPLWGGHSICPRPPLGCSKASEKWTTLPGSQMAGGRGPSATTSLVDPPRDESFLGFSCLFF